MTNKDWKPEGQPLEEIDPLSATGMFLSSLVTESNPSPVQSDELLAQPAVRLETKQPAWSPEQASTPPTPSSLANPENGGSAPGEFTRMFQSEQPSRPTPPRPPEVQSTPLPVEPKPMPTFAPGEFTQVFMKPAEAAPGDPLPAQPARSFVDQPPPVHPVSGPPRMKGFSSGASDSASTEGGFTQFFQPRASSAASSPVSRIQPLPQPIPTPAPSPAPAEIKWQRQSEISPVEGPVDPGASATSATGLLASMGIGGQRKEQIREEVRPRSVDPLPSFTPKPPDAPSAVESASVTKLIQRLSEGVRPAPPVEPGTAAEIPIPTADAGPGEFTKIITASGFKGATSAPVAPSAAAPPAIAFPAAPPLPKPPVPAISIPPAPKPVAPPPVAFQAPKVELPPPPVPKPAPPAVTAPAGKFQEIVPILLVVNTFLLLVLIVLVIFALKAK